MRRRHLRAGSKFADAVINAVELVFGGNVLSDTEVKSHTPSEATFSRASAKVDLLHMSLREAEWTNWRSSGRQTSIQLCYSAGKH